jgi:hypothetical protein
MFNFYFNVNTVDGSDSVGTSAADAFKDAKELHAETGKSIELEIVLMDGKNIYYADDHSPSVNATVLLIEA